ncbi:MAG: hypothetical protein VYC34_06700 [Planctomycetota bacterium]|nr:hypothetical protein [Planctomycetota bacterium]
MNIESTTIDRLTDILADPASTEPLTTEDRALLTAALSQLAADQRALLRMQRLLLLHEESRDRVNEILRESLNRLHSLAAQPAPTAAYDPRRADEIRADLARAAEEAASPRALIAAALAFARDILIVLR